MTTGEQLSAYLAGELDAEERAAVEAALEDDAQLRERLERLRRSEQALSTLPAVEPPAGFSEQLHTALDRELEQPATGTDELARRRQTRFPALRPLGVAAAAAAVIALFGVAGVWLLQGGGQDAGDGDATTAMEAQDASRVPVVQTDNDYDEQRLRRVAVSAEIRELIPQDLTAEGARPLADELQADLLAEAPAAAGAAEPEARAPADTAQDGEEGEGAESFSTGRAADVTASPEAAGRCLPTVLQDARSPLVPVYVELARFKGEPAVIYTLVAEDPESGTYRRVEVWALSPNDCQVLSFAQYDRQ